MTHFVAVIIMPLFFVRVIWPYIDNQHIGGIKRNNCVWRSCQHRPKGSCRWKGKGTQSRPTHIYHTHIHTYHHTHLCTGCVLAVCCAALIHLYIKVASHFGLPHHFSFRVPLSLSPNPSTPFFFRPFYLQWIPLATPTVTNHDDRAPFLCRLHQDNMPTPPILIKCSHHHWHLPSHHLLLPCQLIIISNQNSLLIILLHTNHPPLFILHHHHPIGFLLMILSIGVHQHVQPCPWMNSIVNIGIPIAWSRKIVHSHSLIACHLVANQANKTSMCVTTHIVDGVLSDTSTWNVICWCTLVNVHMLAPTQDVASVLADLTTFMHIIVRIPKKLLSSKRVPQQHLAMLLCLLLLLHPIRVHHQHKPFFLHHQALIAFIIHIITHIIAWINNNSIKIPITISCLVLHQQPMARRLLKYLLFIIIVNRMVLWKVHHHHHPRLLIVLLIIWCHHHHPHHHHLLLPLMMKSSTFAHIRIAIDGSSDWNISSDTCVSIP